MGSIDARLGSSQHIALFLCNELLGITAAHAEHRLNLVAECRRDCVVRTAVCKPRAALRRSHLLARVAATDGAVCVLEQPVRTAVGAGALRVGRARHVWRGAGKTRVYLKRSGYTRVLPGVLNVNNSSGA